MILHQNSLISQLSIKKKKAISVWLCDNPGIMQGSWKNKKPPQSMGVPAAEAFQKTG